MVTPKVGAATINVDSGCSFVQALREAHEQTTNVGSCEAGTDGVGAAGADTINIPAGTTITLSQTQALNSHVTINGNGSTISGNDAVRIFSMSSSNGNVTINRMTLSNGNPPTSAPDGRNGGAIYTTLGSLTLNRVTLRNNVAGGGNGGAIVINGGSITINNSTIYGNTASARGGAIYMISTNSSLELNHVTITNNTANQASGAKGGGMRIFQGTLTLRNSIIFGNTNENCQVATTDVTFTVNTNNVIGGGSSANCSGNQQSGDPLLATSATGNPPYYSIASNSPAVDAATCLAGITVDQRGVTRPQGSACDIGAFEYQPPAAATPTPVPPSGEAAPVPRPSGDDDGADGLAIEAQPTVVWGGSSSCGTLPPEIEVMGYANGTQCQRVDAVGIGNAEVVAAGFRDGVDVWGWAPAGMRVCWRVASGSFKFINTAAMPRTVKDLPAHSYNAMTCTMVDGIGIVALLPGPAAASMPTAISRQSLSGCMVRAQYALNLRDAPAGKVIGGVAYEATLTAAARTVGWFEVDNMGVTGWIAAMYVEPIGNCG